MSTSTPEPRERESSGRRTTDRPPVLSVITPTYNESENIPLFVESVTAALKGIPFEIIVVDDDSPDRTWEVAGKLADADGRIKVIRRFGESGLSSAVMAGLGLGRGRVLAVMDADMQHDEAVLPQMVELITSDKADVVVGTRAVQGGSYGSWGPGRRFVSWVATLIARALLRVPTTDPMSGYFAISRRAFEEVAPSINPQGFKVLLEFIGRRRPGLRVSEVGFTFRNRVHGETKLSPSVIRSYLLAVFELRLGRQVKGQFVLYALVGLSGVAVNLVVFAVTDAIGLGAIDVGFSRPIRWSLLLGIQASILSNFALNNYFTFWERRFHRRRLFLGLAEFEVISAFGVVIHVSIFQFLESTGWGVHLLGQTGARLGHDAVGFLVALVSNYYLNVNYIWRRRPPQ